MLSENQKIWRYQELWKFESMLDKKSLFFSKASEMEDKEEGQTSADNNLIFEHLMDTISQNQGLPQHHREIFTRQARATRQEELEINKLLQHHTLMSCWRVGNDESARAWAEYVGNKKGVAVQSTYGKLKECFEKRGYRVFTGLRKFDEYPEPNNIFVEKVAYEDVGLYMVGKPPYYEPFLYTRKGLSYEWEDELRAFVMLADEINGKGVPVPIGLEHLIETIVVSPRVPELYDEIESLIAEHRLGIDVKNSRVD